MLIVDGKRIEKGSDTESWKNKMMENLKGVKEVLYEKPSKHDDVGLMQSPITRFPLKAFRKDPETGESQEWVLTTKTPKRRANELIYIPNKVSVRKEIRVIPKDNAELAFFFKYIMPNQLSSYGFRLVNEDEDAKKANEGLRTESTVQYLILNDLNYNDIKLRAYAWGIQSVEDKSEEVLKNLLIAKVREGEKKKEGRGYEAFIEEAKENSNTLKLTAYVTEAFQKNILVFEKNKLKVSYMGGSQLCLISATRINNYINETVKFLLANPKAEEVFRVSVGDNVSQIAELAKDFETITNNRALQSMAMNTYGISKAKLPQGIKNEEIKQLIRESLSMVEE